PASWKNEEKLPPLFPSALHKPLQYFSQDEYDEDDNDKLEETRYDLTYFDLIAPECDCPVVKLFGFLSGLFDVIFTSYSYSIIYYGHDHVFHKCVGNFTDPSAQQCCDRCSQYIMILDEGHKMATLDRISGVAQL